MDLFKQYRDKTIDIIKEKRKNPRFLRKLSFYSFEFMLFTYLPFITFLTLCVSYLSLRAYFKLVRKQYLAKGFIQLLPDRFQNILMNRSIFDLLCDTWYASNFSQFVRAFIKPFLSQTTPEDAHLALEELPEEAKTIIFQKGLIKLMPEEVQHIMIPSTEETNKQRDSEFAITPLKTKGNKKSGIKRNKSKKLFKEDQLKFENNFSMPWKYMSSFQEDRQSLLSSSSYQEYSNHPSVELIHAEEVTVNVEPESRTIELIVSQNNNNNNNNIKWDNLDNFYNQVKQSPNTKAPLLKLIKLANFISNIVHFEDRSRKALAINNKTLIKIFAASSIALVVQSIISKRARRFMVSSLVIVFYLGCAGISSGALALYVIKIINQSKKNSKQR